MSTETHPQQAAPATRQRTSPAPTAQPDNPPVERAETGQQPRPLLPAKRNNPPIKRRDGSYRPLDLKFLKKAYKRMDKTRNPERARREMEFWEEFGDTAPW